MIKKTSHIFLCLVVVYLLVPQVWGQQGIGTEKPSKAAALEIKSSSKGILIPKVSLTDLEVFFPISGGNPSSDEVNSLLIYNIASNSVENIRPGYYYWSTNRARWVRLLTDTDDTEPWNIQNTTVKATNNNDSIYLMNSVAIGKDHAIYNQKQVMLDVAGAIRVGSLQDTAVIGENSMAVGQGVIASGKNSIALGRDTEADKRYSFAMGRESKALGTGAVAMGRNSTAYGNYSFAMGKYSKAGVYETVIGKYNAFRNNNKVEWKDSDPLFQVGNGSGAGINERNNALTILKDGRVGIGFKGSDNTTKPEEILDIGSGLVRIRELRQTSGDFSQDSIVVVDGDGILKSVSADSLKSTGPWHLQGNNPSVAATENNQEIYQMGAVAIGKNKVLSVNNTKTMLDVEGAIRGGQMYANPSDLIGKNSIAVGKELTASGENSAAFGYKSKSEGAGAFSGGGATGYTGGKATAENSFAFGRQAEASEKYAIAFGYKPSASGRYSFAVGRESTASANSAIAMGRNTTASGNYATALGRNTIASTGYEMVVGRYNELTSGHNSIGWNDADPLFQVGNGSETEDAHNALTILKDGWVGIGYTQKSNAGNGLEILRVNGFVRADSLICVTMTYPDYVFEMYFDKYSDINSHYKFKSLKEIKQFIQKYRHLPGILPASDLSQNDKGDYEFNLSKLSIKSLEKIEELYLHSIAQQEHIDILQKEVGQLKLEKEKTDRRLDQLEKIVRTLKKESYEK